MAGRDDDSKVEVLVSWRLRFDGTVDGLSPGEALARAMDERAPDDVHWRLIDREDEIIVLSTNGDDELLDDWQTRVLDADARRRSTEGSVETFVGRSPLPRDPYHGRGPGRLRRR